MLLIILLSIAVLIFVAGNVARVVKFLRMPTPLRWELYPIPKGRRERQRYGGSYFEDSNWWTKREIVSHRGELAFMAREVLLLKSVRDSFRGLWLWSWLLHWGLYLYVSATVLGVISIPAVAETLRIVAAWGYRVACPIGLLGSLGLLVMRGSHPRLRPFTTRTSIFNLLLLAAIFASGIASLISGATVRGALAGNLRPELNAHLVLVVFFLAYFSFTHMTHAYMKFFTWHSVRWDDSPAFHDPLVAATLAANLKRKVTWAAPHIAGGDAATWSEVVSDPSGQGAAKRA
jgi:nitrate reductase gamma subunit